MIVLLTEERSMAALLKSIMPKLWPGSTSGVEWLALSFDGKSDLERSMRRKMAGWSYGNPHFIILRDNDGGDCFVIKEGLCHIARQSGKPFHVRIVCQMLESWLLGDLAAIRSAYPRATVRNKAMFRSPDRLTNASQVLERLIDERAKIPRASNIGRYFDLENNRSQSFNVFVRTLIQLIRSHGAFAEAPR